MNKIIKTQFGNFIKIPPGEFIMGNAKEYSSYFGKIRVERKQARKEHKVLISKFLAVLDTPVTVGQFKLFAKERKMKFDDVLYSFLNNKIELRDYCNTDKTEYQFKRKWSKGKLAEIIEDSSKANYPMIGVSYNDCLEYCEWLSAKLGMMVRLPSEAEWEYCCKASGNTVFHWGSDVKEVSKYAWCCINSNLEIQEVKKLAPNQWGLYDMTGNIWVWCLDRYSKIFYNYSAYENPICKRPNCNRFSIRGGSSFNKAETCRSTHRFGLNPEVRNEYLGFRILIEIQ